METLNIAPEWAALALIIADYGIPTFLAVFVVINRNKFLAAVPMAPVAPVDRGYQVPRA